MQLIDEIERCPAVFDGLDDALLVQIGSRYIRTLLRRKNGALALSGALILFGCGNDQAAPLHWSAYRFWAGRSDYGLRPTDDVFGADIFGDLMFVRDGEVFRLDGELGDHVSLGGEQGFFEADLIDVAESLGGRLARERFAGRSIGADPLRLLPTAPFMMSQHVRGDFFETPLARAIALKRRLFLACQAAPDGAGIDCSFWQA